MTQHFRLYAKRHGAKRFSPVDWQSGKQVVNLIHATIFTAEERAVAERELQESDERSRQYDSPGPIRWEFRPANW